LRKIAKDLCEKRHAAFLPDDDMGESHLFIRLA
jgi:hypothetical protein